MLKALLTLDMAAAYDVRIFGHVIGNKELGGGST